MSIILMPFQNNFRNDLSHLPPQSTLILLSKQLHYLEKCAPLLNALIKQISLADYFWCLINICMHYLVLFIFNSFFKINISLSWLLISKKLLVTLLISKLLFFHIFSIPLLSAETKV